MELPAARSSKAFRFLCLLLAWHSFASSTSVAAAFEDDELTEPRVMVTGVLGGRVGLPCNIQPNSTEDEVSLVLWYRDDSTTPIYSLDSRKTTLRNAHHAPVYWLNGRAYLKTAAATAIPSISSGLGLKRANDEIFNEAVANPQTSLLELKDLEKQDEALYRCRVDFKKARTRNYEVQLKVIVPPSRIAVTDQRGTILQNNAVIGPYSGGDKLVLKCQAHGGNPSSTVSWYRGAILLPPTSSKTPEGPQDFLLPQNGLELLQSAEHESDLVFPSLGQENLLVTHTCVVSNNNISQPLTTSVTLDIYFRPSRVWISTAASSVLSAGVAVTFQCSSSGSRPPAVIQWFKGGEKLNATTSQNSSSSSSSSNNSSIGTWHTSTIELIPRPEDDGKQLTCRADNPAMPPSINHDYHGRHGNAITDGITLEVQYVPQLVVRLGKKLRHPHIREGSDVILECDVRANPQLIEMGWKYEGTELITDTSRGIVISELSLVLQNVTRHNRGHYVCTGTNAEGTGESEPFHLRVQYEPICKAGLKQVYGAARNEPVRISCELEADPEEVTIKWKTKKMKYGISAQNFVTSPPQSTNGFLAVEEDSAKDTSYFVETEGTRSWLTIIPRSEDDYGPVICWGKNQMGRQKDPCVFTLIAAGPPGPVHNCSVINQTEESLTISCLEGYDGGSEGGQTFHMEVHDSANQNRVLIANLSTSASPPSLQATGLSPSTPYVCTIYAANERGTSQPTILVASTIPRPLSLSSKGGFIFDYIDGRLSLSNSPALIAFAITAALSSLALGTFLVVVLIRRTSGFSHMFKKNGNKDPHNETEKDDDDPSIPLQESKKDQTGITDFRSFSDSEEDKKCPDILSETQIISSPLSAAESSFVRRSPSCNSQLLRPDGGTTSPTNRCLKRDSWDLSNHKPRNSLPSSLSYQHMATIPRKCQGQQNSATTTSSGLKTPSTKTVTFDITPSTHPYAWVDSGSFSLSLPRSRGSASHAFLYETALSSSPGEIAAFQRSSQRAKLLTLAEPQRAKVLKCPLSLPATTSVQALGGPSSQQQTTTTTLVHAKNKAPLARRDEGHL